MKINKRQIAGIVLLLMAIIVNFLTIKYFSNKLDIAKERVIMTCMTYNKNEPNKDAICEFHVKYTFEI